MQPAPPKPEPAPAAVVKPVLAAPANALPLQSAALRPDPDLKLNGIALGKTPLAIINGKGVAEGESATIPAKPKPVSLKCLKIEKDFVLVSLDGEDTPRRLIRN